jgi:DNA-binding PadR family transcriptional regulator
MTNAELAILSLIAEQARHGYEIEQVIQERGMREWTEVGFSSIYYLLKRLEQLGFIEGRSLPKAGKGPARKVYAITTAGWAAWKAETLRALSEPQRCYKPLQIGLANLNGLSRAEALSALEQYSQQLSERREHVSQRRQENGEPLPFHVAAMFDLSLALIQAELDWVVKFTEQLTQSQSAGLSE